MKREWLHNAGNKPRLSVWVGHLLGGVPCCCSVLVVGCVSAPSFDLAFQLVVEDVCPGGGHPLSLACLSVSSLKRLGD